MDERWLSSAIRADNGPLTGPYEGLSLVVDPDGGALLPFDEFIGHHGAALIGGETAEMPGMYAGQDYDLAGFCVGIVDKDKLIDGKSVQPGDTLVALASSGPHSNGYSLIRRIIEVSGAELDSELAGRTLLDWLLEPTRIYVKPLLALLEQVEVRSLCHITGGGLPENLPRVLPAYSAAEIDRGSWQLPAAFDWLQRSGNIDDSEMLRTFNCGIGIVAVVPDDEADIIVQTLNDSGTDAWRLGQVEASSGAAAVRFK